MREPLSFDDWLNLCSDKVPTDIAAGLKNDLGAEIRSIRLREKSFEILNHLKGQGYAIGICSNLAMPYGKPLLEVLRVEPDAIILSYEVGCIKPETEIYRAVSDKLDLKPETILFTGDTPKADIDGPRAFGMQSMSIFDFENSFHTMFA